jgi:hypothetical protein
MGMEHLVERELPRETKLLGENLHQCHFVHNKSHMTSPGIEPAPLRWKLASNYVTYDTAFTYI